MNATVAFPPGGPRGFNTSCIVVTTFHYFKKKMVIVHMEPAVRFKCPSFTDVWLPYIKSKKTLNVRYGQEGEYFQGISYYLVPKDIEAKVLKVLPENLRGEFEVFLMVINAKEIPPHVDSNSRATINFYMKTGSGKTFFYKETEPSTKTKIKNQTDGYILDTSCLQETFSFEAKEDEAWILNTKVPHSVQCDSIRIAFVLQCFKHSYEDVVKMCT
jgi:hypothetical protein